jgi:hypothetical protein
VTLNGQTARGVQVCLRPMTEADCEISDYDPRSWRAFQRVGYEIFAEIEQPPGSKARVGIDLALTRDA